MINNDECSKCVLFLLLVILFSIDDRYFNKTNKIVVVVVVNVIHLNCDSFYKAMLQSVLCPPKIQLISTSKVDIARPMHALVIIFHFIEYIFRQQSHLNLTHCSPTNKTKSKNQAKIIIIIIFARSYHGCIGRQVGRSMMNEISWYSDGEIFTRYRNEGL